MLSRALFSCAVVACLAASVVDARKAKHTIVSSTDSFDDDVGSGPAVVFFHAPWCGHCKKFAPQFEQAARAMKEEAKFIKVDATEHRGLATRFTVRGYPTLFHVQNGEVRRYVGGWSKTSLQDFVRGGWEKVQPLPYWTSPMSPFLRMRGQAMKALNSFASLHKGIARLTGLPDLIAGFVLLLVTVMSFCSGIVLFAAWLGDDRRPPAAPANPARDVRGTARRAAAAATAAAVGGSSGTGAAESEGEAASTLRRRVG